VSLDEPLERLLAELAGARVEFIVVGGLAAVLQGAPIVTLDLDVVHRRAPDNVDRLLDLLARLGAYGRFDLANRRLAPTREHLMGRGHVNVQTSLGPLDLLCELGEGEGYEQLLDDTVELREGDLAIRVLGLPRLVRVKAAAARPKDRLMLPILVATLEERSKHGQ
jgi:hypothetical protein